MMTRPSSPTGVRCRYRSCGGEVVYNGHYFCEACGREHAVTPQMYAGLFDRRYPKGDFEDHPNFDRRLYEKGKSR